MKIIFLDIDGVLNGYGYWIDKLSKIVSILHLKKAEQYLNDNIIGGIDERRVKLLADIVNKTGAKIVVSSSWRDGLQKSYSYYLAEEYEKIPEDHMKFIKLFEKYNLYVFDYTPHVGTGSRRDYEVNNYLSTLGNSVKSFIILDDEPIMFPLYLSSLKLTDIIYGLCFSI